MQSVAELLPHQPPMRLLDRILAFDTRQVCAVTAINTLPFRSPQGLHACYGLELMAQTAAAFFTLHTTQDAPPRQGMLIACRQFSTRIAHYPVDSCLVIHARLASALPNDATSPALVKFDGQIAVFDAPDAIPTADNELFGLDAKDVVTQATLSVYL